MGFQEMLSLVPFLYIMLSSRLIASLLGRIKKMKNNLLD